MEVDGRRLRLHDYPALFAVPGLYEAVVQEALRCRAPEVVAALLAGAADGAPLRVADLGAGNGVSGEALRAHGLDPVVALDLLPEARAAALRDRPGLYRDYLAADAAALGPADEGRVRACAPQALTAHRRARREPRAARRRSRRSWRCSSRPACSRTASTSTSATPSPSGGSWPASATSTAARRRAASASGRRSSPRPAEGAHRKRACARWRFAPAGSRMGRMPSSMWSGAISFGLVNVPVKLYSAVSKKTVRFHQLNGKTGHRIAQKRTDSQTGDDVSFEDIVKGYELTKDRYVVITPDELETLDPVKSRSIDIEDFVNLADIDPVYYDHPYYLVPGQGLGEGLRAAARRDARVRQGGDREGRDPLEGAARRDPAGARRRADDGDDDLRRRGRLARVDRRPARSRTTSTSPTAS